MNYKPILRKLKKAAPYILSGLSVIGVAATAILSAKATAKALEQVEERDDTWKCYIPTALTAIATCACIISNGVLNRKQQASLISAYTLLAGSYKKYREKTKAIYGEEADRLIINGMAVEQAKTGFKIYNQGLVNVTSSGWDHEEDEVKHLFYDTLSERYFESTLSRVYQAELALNRNMSVSCGGFVTVNDFYKFLGLEPISGGDEIGWALCDCYTFVEFNHYSQKIEDDPGELEVYVIDYEWLPQTPAELDW